MRFIEVQPEARSVVEFISEDGKWKYTYHKGSRYFPHSIIPVKPLIGGAWGQDKLEAMIKAEIACREAVKAYNKLADLMHSMIESEKKEQRKGAEK